MLHPLYKIVWQNILAAKAPSKPYLFSSLPNQPIVQVEELTFIHPDDVALYNAWDSRSFELQVANHELLGHGSGKLFEEDQNGKKNFNPEKVQHTAPILNYAI